MRSCSCVVLLAALALSGAASAAPVTPPTAKPIIDVWSGTFATCGQPEGATWRLAPAAGGYAVTYRNSSLEAWQAPPGLATVLAPADLARLNATGSSRDPRDQAQAALSWQQAHFLQLPTGWFDRYRAQDQAFTPDLVLTGGGYAVFLCRQP